MVVYGVVENFVRTEPFGTVLIAFGVIGAINAFTDLGWARRGGLRGRERIAQHLGHMLGGTIAAITGVLRRQPAAEP